MADIAITSAEFEATSASSISIITITAVEFQSSGTAIVSDVTITEVDFHATGQSSARIKVVAVEFFSPGPGEVVDGVGYHWVEYRNGIWVNIEQDMNDFYAPNWAVV